jgi:hypothetical protein
MELLDQAKNKAKMLYLEFSDDFCLEFCGHTQSYKLRNPKNPFCHPLETFLICDSHLSGHKIADIARVSKRNYRWILGFFHGFADKISRYSSVEYKEGYSEGLKIKLQK